MRTRRVSAFRARRSSTWWRSIAAIWLEVDRWRWRRRRRKRTEQEPVVVLVDSLPPTIDARRRPPRQTVSAFASTSESSSVAMPGFTFDFSKVANRAKALFPFLAGTSAARTRDGARRATHAHAPAEPAGPGAVRRAQAAARPRQRRDAVGDRQVVVAARSVAPVQRRRRARERAQPGPGAPAGAARRLRRRRTGCSRTSITSIARSAAVGRARPGGGPRRLHRFRQPLRVRAIRRRARPPSCCSCSTSWRREASTR